MGNRAARNGIRGRTGEVFLDVGFHLVIIHKAQSRRFPHVYPHAGGRGRGAFHQYSESHESRRYREKGDVSGAFFHRSFFGVLPKQFFYLVHDVRSGIRRASDWMFLLNSSRKASSREQAHDGIAQFVRQVFPFGDQYRRPARRQSQRIVPLVVFGHVGRRNEDGRFAYQAQFGERPGPGPRNDDIGGGKGPRPSR